MEYQEMINLLDNKPNQPSNFSTRNWVEINDSSRGSYNTNSQIKLKTSMLKSRLSDYGHVYIGVSGTLTVKNTGAANNNNSNTAANNTVIQAVFENCTPFY